MLKKISNFVIKNSLWVIIGSILFTLVIGIFMKNLYIDNDIKNWVSPNSKIGKMPHYIDKRFSGTSPVLVVITSDDVFNYETLSVIRNISRKAKEFDSVDMVMSITEAVDMKSDSEGIIIEDLFGDTIPNDKSKLEEIKKYILSKAFYNGKIVSANSKSAMILIKIKAGEKGDIIAKKVKTMVMDSINPKTMKAYVGGNPAIMNDLSEMVLADLWFLIPGVVLIIVSILFMSFRSIRGVILPLATVVMATIIALGLMGLLGGTFSMLGAALPVILIAVSSAYGLHYLNRYYEASSKAELNVDTIVKKTSADIGIPIIMAGMTTFFGFLSLVVSDVTIIRSFGVYISIGVVFAFVLSLVFVPALLHRIKVQKHKGYSNNKKNKEIKASKFALFISTGLTKFRWIIIIFYVLITALAIFYIKDVRTELDYIAYFKPDSETTKISKIINKNFGGFSPFSMYLKGEMQNADIQKLMVVIEESVKNRADMNSVGGIHNIISELNYLMTGVRTIPETTPEIDNLWFFIDGQDDISSMVTSDKKEAIITFMLPSVSTEFESGFYPPLQQFINLYTNSFKMIAVKPTNSQVIALVLQMLANSYKNVLTNQNDKAKIEKLTIRIANTLIGMKATFPIDEVYNYLISDECEIEFTDKNKARRLANYISILRDYQTDTIDKLLLVLLPKSTDYNYDDDDVQSLSESIAMITANNFRVTKMKKAVSIITNSLGNSIDVSSVEYAIGAFLWNSFPVANNFIGTVQRTVDLENLEITGNSYLYYQVKMRLTFGQMVSIFLAIIAVLILNSITFKNFKIGLVSLVPIVFTLIINFGIMGLFNIPLDVITAVIASIAIGTGIDYTIHFITRYKIEYKKYKGDREKAISITLTTVGKGILFNALSVGLGFLVLLFGNVIPMRTLGGMLAISMLISSTSALVLLPMVLNKIKIKDKV